MSFKKILKVVGKCALTSAFTLSIFTNYITYKTIKRQNNNKEMWILDEANLMRAIKKIGGNDLESKIKKLFNEKLTFNNNEGSEKFNKKLFNFLDYQVGQVKDTSWTLEEKIRYAQLFSSSSLDYNDAANFIEYINKDEGKGVFKKALKSLSENLKIRSMDVDEILAYKSVVCQQYAEVFSAALNSINNSSTNPEKIHTGVLVYVPDHNFNYSKRLNLLLSVSNAVVFSEFRSSVPHSLNVIMTSDKLYIIDPQRYFPNSNCFYKVVFNQSVKLDINKDYLKNLN